MKYLLGILNSKLALWYFEQIASSSGMGTNRWKKYKIEKFPIKNANNTEMKKIICIVDEILSITRSDDYLSNSKKLDTVLDLEHQVDSLIYNLYDMSSEEINIIEQSIKS